MPKTRSTSRALASTRSKQNQIGYSKANAKKVGATSKNAPMRIVIRKKNSKIIPIKVAIKKTVT